MEANQGLSPGKSEQTASQTREAVAMAQQTPEPLFAGGHSQNAL